MYSRLIKTNWWHYKVVVAESGSLVRLRCESPKDFHLLKEHHSSQTSPSNQMISWEKQSPKDLIFQGNDNNNQGGNGNRGRPQNRWRKEEQKSLTPFSDGSEDTGKSLTLVREGVVNLFDKLLRIWPRIEILSDVLVHPRQDGIVFLGYSSFGYSKRCPVLTSFFMHILNAIKIMFYYLEPLKFETLNMYFWASDDKV